MHLGGGERAVPKRASRRAGCVGKIRHDTKGGALVHRGRMVDQGAAAGAFEVYRCRHCGGWHVGHARERRR